MQRILVATDYSRAAANALAYAAALAQHTRAKLMLFNAYQLPAPLAVSMLPEDHKNSYLEDNRARLGSLARQISQRYNIEVSWTAKQSYFTEELDQQVARAEADLVVLGIRQHAIEGMLIGSKTTSLIRHAKYPILLVPEGYTFSRLHRILFACDYHLLASDNKLELLQQIAMAFQAQVQVLHVEKEAGDLVTAAYQGDPYRTIRTDKILASVNLDTIFTNIKHSYKYVEDSDVLQGIDRGIEEFGADMLVMVPHKTGFWEALLDKSNTCKMAYRTHIPLLALPNKPL